MRRLIGILLALCFLLTAFVIPPPVGAKVPEPGDPNVRTAKFWIGKKFYEVNGVRQAMDVAPVIKNGRTLLPLRYVGYAMGLKEQDVSWEPAVGWARLKRWYGTGDYDYDEVIFRTCDDRSRADYILLNRGERRNASASISLDARAKCKA